jgi:hypothetical protein
MLPHATLRHTTPRHFTPSRYTSRYSISRYSISRSSMSRYSMSRSSMSRYSMSRYSMSRYSMSRYSMSRYNMSRYSMSRYSMSRYSMSRKPCLVDSLQSDVALRASRRGMRLMGTQSLAVSGGGAVRCYSRRVASLSGGDAWPGQCVCVSAGECVMEGARMEGARRVHAWSVRHGGPHSSRLDTRGRLVHQGRHQGRGRGVSGASPRGIRRVATRSCCSRCAAPGTRSPSWSSRRPA